MNIILLYCLAVSPLVLGLLVLAGGALWAFAAPAGEAEPADAEEYCGRHRREEAEPVIALPQHPKHRAGRLAIAR